MKKQNNFKKQIEEDWKLYKINEMKKQDNLEEQIATGIERGFWKPLLSAFYTLAITLVVVVAVIYFIGHLQNYEYCGEWNCDMMAVAQITTCSTSYVTCDIIIGNETYEFNLLSQQLCGWEEAQAFLELNKGIYHYNIKRNSHTLWKQV